MSDYDRPPRRARNDRPPYPADPQDDDGDRRPRPTKTDAAPSGDRGKSDIPPPPLGSAMKREGSRTRAANLKPEFPEEASFLNGRSPDLERKNGDRDRRFRERREGYGSEEGESLRSDARRQRGTRDRPPASYDDRRSGNESSGATRGGAPRDRRRDDDDHDRRDDRRRPARDYDDRPRQRKDYDEDSDRRKPHKSAVEYGADPVRPIKRSDTARKDDRRDDRARRDRYDDDSDDDDYARRRRSQPAPPRRGGKSDDDDYDRDGRDSRRYRDDDRDRRRPAPARRRSHDDYDDKYDRRDRRDKRDDRDRDRRDDKRREPTHMKIGNVDIGPALDKGQKYYGSLAPILTPLVMNYLKNKK